MNTVQWLSVIALGAQAISVVTTRLNPQVRRRVKGFITPEHRVILLVSFALDITALSVAAVSG